MKLLASRLAVIKGPLAVETATANRAAVVAVLVFMTLKNSLKRHQCHFVCNNCCDAVHDHRRKSGRQQGGTETG